MKVNTFYHCTCILLHEESHKKDLKFTHLELEQIAACIFLHCTECPLHSPIYNNKACSRKLNIATWSYDIRQAIQAGNHKQRGPLDISFNLAGTVMTNFLPLYFINESSQPNGNIYPFNAALFKRYRGYVTSTKGSLATEKEEEISLEVAQSLRVQYEYKIVHICLRRHYFLKVQRLPGLIVILHVGIFSCSLHLKA